MDDYQALVADLAVPYRASKAYWALFNAGWDAYDAVRVGLEHENANVRAYCCRYFDHFLTPDALDALIGMLGDPDPDVKCAILHTLACDKCKEGECRPTQAIVLPAALDLLTSDPHPLVRAMAIETVGAWVHVSEVAEKAIQHSAATDHSPAVRKKAAWYAPGGTVHARTKPKPQRRRAVATKP